jgi:hypothetical protein
MPTISAFAPKWHYTEFAGKTTPDSNINATLTWLNNTLIPPGGDGTVFGNIDSNGDVRLFWYGSVFPVFEPV